MPILTQVRMNFHVRSNSVSCVLDTSQESKGINAVGAILPLREIFHKYLLGRTTDGAGQTIILAVVSQTYDLLNPSCTACG